MYSAKNFVKLHILTLKKKIKNICSNLNLFANLLLFNFGQTNGCLSRYALAGSDDGHVAQYLGRNRNYFEIINFILYDFCKRN